MFFTSNQQQLPLHMNKTILISSLIIITVLLAEAYRENLDMDWQRYQKKYKYELTRLAKTDQERKTAGDYGIRMRQLVMPDFNRADRCVTCHVAMEDYRMSDMPHPLRSHPGDFLDTHDVNKIGCTLCHDGQGRAITKDDAHALVGKKYWEKPLLEQPFIESNCARCHVNPLAQTPKYNHGIDLFKTRGCVACHKIRGEGGNEGPELTNITNASFHVKMPTEKNRAELLEKFHHNTNLAYLYEAIKEPQAQPAETKMPHIDFTEQEIISLMVYLKSLTAERRVMDVGQQMVAKAIFDAPRSPLALSAPGGQALNADISSKGYAVFVSKCIACHTIGGGKRVGPDLKGVTDRRNRDWLGRMIKTPTDMIAKKDPIAIQLLEEYKVPMTDMGLSDEEVEEVIKYLENPQVQVQDSGAASADTAERFVKVGQRVATQSEILKGRDLFQGKIRFFNKGPSCISCHDVRNDAIIGGGILAKELTSVFTKMGGEGVRAILTNAPFPVMQEAYKKKPLLDDEIFALVSFLEKVDEDQLYHQPRDYGVALFTTGVVGTFVLLGVYSLIWRRRKKDPVNKDIYDRQIKSE